jgi:hypothetical protein
MPPLAVLGHYPDYIALGWKLNAQIFSIDPELWLQSDLEWVWVENVKFLDRMISVHSRFLLATEPDRVRPDSFLARELAYLMSLGYEAVRTGDGWELVR